MNGFEFVFWGAWGRIPGKEKLHLTPNMMYPLKVHAKTQFKSESLKPREQPIKLKRMVCYKLDVRQQKC